VFLLPKKTSNPNYGVSNMTTQLISRDFHGARIRQRSSDGYLCATDMCQATGKRLNDYRRLKSTQEYLDVFSLKTGIPVIKIIEVKSGRYGGTWIHPKASINLAQWNRICRYGN
jgi:hypothetical protein